jgi:TRAP-type mannitol/chloroaromatic compound transport system substrate-binding protein
MEIRFIKPFTSVANTQLTTEAVSANQTKVKWGMKGTYPYPLNIMNLFVDNVLGKDLETSLATLKSVLEK